MDYIVQPVRILNGYEYQKEALSFLEQKCWNVLCPDSPTFRFHGWTQNFDTSIYE